MTKYDNKQIAKELMLTASGASYFGNALYVAKDYPGLTVEERTIIQCWLSGVSDKSGMMAHGLQDIAIKIHNEE